ncbi:MAG: TonB family protein [Moraxellaceae bacterium]
MQHAKPVRMVPAAKPPARAALRKSLLLHVAVLGLVLLLPYLHVPPKVEPPRVVEAVLVSAKTLTPPAPVKPLPPPPPIEPEPEPLPEPVKAQPKPEPVPVKVPEPVKPLPKAAETKIALPKPEEKKPTPKPEIRPEPVKAAPPKPIIKKPTLQADAFDDEMQSLQQQMRNDEAEKLKRDAEKSTAQALSNSDNAVIQKYTLLLRDRMQRFAAWPPGTPSGTKVVIRVSMLPGGEVVSVVIIKSSGTAIVDESARQAAIKASPLPVPSDPRLFNNFRSGIFTLTVE